MSAPTWQAVSAGSETSAAWPTHVAGDLAILDVEHGPGTIATPSDGAGRDFAITPGSTYAINVASCLRSGFYRRATSNAEPDAALSGAADHMWGAISLYRNVHQVYPFHAYASNVGSSSSIGRSPRFKTTIDDCLIHVSIARGSDSATAGILSGYNNSDLTGETTRLNTGTTTGGGGGLVIVDGAKDAAGDITEGIVTWTATEYGVQCIALAPIADIVISGTVTRAGQAVSTGSVRLLDITQPAATYLVLNGSEQDAAASVSGGAFSMLVPYTDHEYIAIYTDSSGEVYGASQVLTYSGGAFPSATIEIGGVSFPVLSGTTTPENIRDRIIALIGALTPTSLAGDKFRVWRDEGEADFRTAAAATPAACLRRFQVRSIGKRGTPLVTNCDVARHEATFQIIVAYPNTHRYGAAAGRSRDDVIDEDLRALDFACGIYGRGNFTVATSSDCTPLGFDEDPPVETEGKVSFLVVTARYEYAFQVGS